MRRSVKIAGVVVGLGSVLSAGYLVAGQFAPLMTSKVDPVYQHDHWVLTFDENMDSTTIDSTTVYVTGSGGTIIPSVVTTPSNTTVEVAPAASIGEWPMTLPQTLNVTSGVKDTQGRNFAGGTWSLSATPAAWS